MHQHHTKSTTGTGESMPTTTNKKRARELIRPTDIYSWNT
jgi:hypothetical protein